MTFKEVSYNYNEIARTLFKKGKRKKDDPVKQLKNDRIMRHEKPEKNSKWFKNGNKIKIIVLDKNIDKYSRRNLESCFIINLLRAKHPLYNKQ